MSIKEIDNENPPKANATRDNMYTIHTIQMHPNEYIEQDPNKPTTTSMSEKGIAKVCE